MTEGISTEQQIDLILGKLVDATCENRALIEGLIQWGNDLIKSLEEAQHQLLIEILRHQSQNYQLRKRLSRVRVPEEFSQTLGYAIERIDSMEGEIKFTRKKQEVIGGSRRRHKNIL